MRRILVRSLAVLGIGLLILVGVLYYASTVDGRAPVVERIGLTQHVSGSDAVALTTTSVEVEFSEPVRADTAQAAFRTEPRLAGAFSWSGTTMTFTPANRLPLETDFRVLVEATVLDEAGNRMAEPAAEFSFRTVGPPTVTATQPEDGATGVALDAQIVIEFSSLMSTASVDEALTIQPAVPVEAIWSAERLTLVPVGQLAEGTRYTIRISTRASDDAGNPLVDAFRFGFETTPSPMTVVQLVPADGIEGAAVSGPIAIVLDREVDAGANLGELFSIEPEVAGNLEVVAPPGAAGLLDPTRRIVRFQPSAPLAGNSTYRVTLASGLPAADGSTLAEPIEWGFTTAAPLNSLGNQVVFISDRAGIANLWSMNPDGSAQRQVTAELSPVIDYAVAPDGRSVVLGDGAVLVRQDVDGTDREVLTLRDVLEFDPAWAPDGSRFAFGRADAATGAGLGLWIRDASGGEAVQVELPAELTPGSPSPTSSPDEETPPASVLRAPRFSPDGAALAYVDVAGRIGVLELPAGRLSTARFAAVGALAWLGDSTAVIVAGLPDGAIDAPGAGMPLPPLDPSTVGLTVVEVGSLQLGQLDRGAVTVEPFDLPGGAARPSVAGDGRLLFVAIRPGRAPMSGDLWLVADLGQPESVRSLADDGEEPVISASFGVETRTIIAARPTGIWLVDALTGRWEQLATDGWAPRWLP